MDGKRIQSYWSNEMQAMLDTYKQFQILIPAANKNGAAHYIETSSKNRIKK